jgi:hypothetical protein
MATKKKDPKAKITFFESRAVSLTVRKEEYGKTLYVESLPKGYLIQLGDEYIEISENTFNKLLSVLCDL